MQRLVHGKAAGKGIRRGKGALVLHRSESRRIKTGVFEKQNFGHCWTCLSEGVLCIYRSNQISGPGSRFLVSAVHVSIFGICEVLASLNFPVAFGGILKIAFLQLHNLYEETRYFSERNWSTSLTIVSCYFYVISISAYVYKFLVNIIFHSRICGHKL